MKKRFLSILLSLCMVLSLIPASAFPVLAADKDESTTGTKDALGITMAEWTAEEKAAAEANLPFGTGYGTWTTLMEISELYLSIGYDRNTRLTGLFDWNSDANGKSLENVPDSTIKDNIDKLKQDDLTKVSEGYKAVATAAMDLKGSGKKEYVANLALNKDGNTLTLYVTDSSNKKIGNSVTFDNVKHLGSFEVHQVNGLFAVAAGDFDGDGVDTVVVYVPQTDSNQKTSGSVAPFIREYSVTSSGVWSEKSTVHKDVLGLLGNNGIDKLTDTKNQPMVALLAEDVDKDGFDELIVTAGMNDTTSQDTQLGTKVFIYDKLSKASTSGSVWNQSYYRDDKTYGEGREIQITDYGNRMVWGSTSVGNIINSTDTTKLDYPEIVTAGFIDNESKKQQNINIDSSDPIGVSVLQAQEVIDETNKFTVSYTTTENNKKVTKTMTSVNVICSYKEVLNQQLDANGWTKGGLYEDEDVNSLLQVQVYAAKGLGAAESVFISGTVYCINSSGKLEEEYKHNSFKSEDKGAGSGTDGRSVTNTMVAAVTAGNFNGNADGREQLIFVTCLKESGKNNAFSRVYCYYYDKDTGNYVGEDSSYLTEHKGHFYVTLATLDTDDDSIIAKLESVDRDYSSPTVMAILEAVPYFAETQEKGEGETIYGLAKSQGTGSSESLGYTLGSSMGYEFESTIAQSGGGFEIAVDRAYNWDTEHTTTISYEMNMKNTEGNNLVYVSRYPVVTYTYRDKGGNKMVVEKVGQPASSMITVEEYNEAASAYGLTPITRETTGISTAGDPYSYVRTATELAADGMTEIVQFNGVTASDKNSTASSTDTDNGWVQYSSSGVIEEVMKIDVETQKTFNYDLQISLTVFAKFGGVTASGTAGFTYGYSKTSVDGSSVTKSGAVNGAKFDGYDFQWKFAAWNCKLNGDTVPVLGYFLKDVVSPPSPPEGIAAENVTTDSITLRWASGTRSATQYRIYRMGDTSDTDYVLVGAVSGDETSYTLTGLKPGETYTYVIRGVAFEDDGDAVESVDSAPVTVRTQAQGSSVSLKIHGVTTDNVLQSTGKTATLSVEVSGTNGGSISYQWQVLEAGMAGTKNGWVAAGSLDGIGAASGVKSSTLKLTTIDSSLDGSYLRCVVNVTSKAGDVETYYSPIVTLDLSGLSATATIDLSGSAVTGSGTITDPYVGLSDYTQTNAVLKTDYVITPLRYTDADGNVYNIYSHGDTDKVYVAVSGDDYYTATVTVANQAPYPETTVVSIDDKLTVKPDSYYCSDGENTVEYTIPNGFDGDTTVFETVQINEMDTETYVKQYAVTTNENSVTFTPYWLCTTDSTGQYYTKSEDGFDVATPQPSANADLRSVYYENGSTLILSASALRGADDEGSEIILISEYDRYEVYERGEDDSVTSKIIWREQDTGLYTADDSLYADFTELGVVYNWNEVSETVTSTEAKPGTMVTLSADVKDSKSSAVNTTVVFTITNTTTGVATALTTTSGNGVTWTAPNYGLYRIVVTAFATTGAKSATSECYYLADDNATDYRLVLMQGNTQVTNLTYDGSSVKPVLEKKVGNEWIPLESGITYRANNTDLTGNTCTPDVAGNYVFSALMDGKTVATSVLTVNKKAITVTPVWSTTDNATNTIPAFSDIELLVTDAQGNVLNSSILNNSIKISCSLYDADGSIKASSKSGTYKVTPVYVSDDDRVLFLSRYDVTVNTADIFYSSGALTVYFASGENGTIYARYIDPSGTEFAFDSGSQISMDYGLKFVAEPREGWSVDAWTITIPWEKITGNEEDSRLDNWCTRYGNTLELSVENMSLLRQWIDFAEEFLKKEIDVSVTFTNKTHKITYSTGNNGTLSATVDGNTIASGVSVAHNASVTFSATPAEGYMVDKWTVDGTEYTWDCGDRYCEQTLTLENISASTDVIVTFTEVKSTTFHITAADENGARPAGATISATNAQGNELQANDDGSYIIPYADAVTFTATLESEQISVVKEWQTSANGSDWVTVSGSGSQDSITIYTHEYDSLFVRAVIVSTQTYILNWNVSDRAGWGYADDGVELKAYSNGVQLANGKAFPAFTSVDFVLTLPDAFELVGWTDNVTVDPDDSTRAYIENLTEDTTVKATIRKKVAVTVNFHVEDIGDGTHGTLTASVGEAALESGSSILCNETVLFIATPDDGYRVQAWTVNGVTQTVTANAFSLAVTEDLSTVDVTVQFMPKGDRLVFSAGEHGSITNVTVNGRSYNFTTGLIVSAGSQVVVTAVPNDGYEVKEWLIDGTVVSGETGTTFTWNASGESGAEIRVEFQPVAYQVEWSAQNATISAAGYNAGSALIRGGETVIFTAHPKSGFRLDRWTVNGETQEERGTTFSFTLSIDAEKDAVYHIEAVFVPEDVQYTVTYSATGGGNISVLGGENGTITVDSGSSVTFTATPIDNWMVQEWQVDGVSVPDSANLLSYTLENVATSHSVTVVFQAEVLFRIDYEITGEGTLEITENGSTLHLSAGQTRTTAVGTKLVFTAVPAMTSSDHQTMVAQWLVNGTPVTKENMANLGVTLPHSLSNILTVESLQSNMTITVVFADYVGYAIPISSTSYTVSAITRTPDSTAPDSQIRKNGDLTFTLTPTNFGSFDELIVNGYDCILASGEALGCDSVSAVKNSDGSYTVTVTNVTADITLTAKMRRLSPDTFTDISENDWFYNDVAYVYAANLMNGTGEHAFSPNETTTRGMIVTVLYRLEGEPSVSGDCSFGDVKVGAYCENAIVWAEENGIVSGYGNGQFGPGDPITREQMAVILYRYALYKKLDVSVGENTNILSYRDALDIAEYAFSAMQWVCGEGIMQGGDENLMPKGNATRAQVAALLHRFCVEILK